MATPSSTRCSARAVSEPVALPDGPAERHRQIGQVFTDRVRGTRSWDMPAPVSGWVARDVVRHLVEWLPALLAGGSTVRLPAVPSVDDDPVSAWQAHVAAVQELLDDHATAGLTLSNPHIGALPVERAIDQFYTSDVFMHTWDLARATGQDDRLDSRTCAMMLAGMEPLEHVIRSSGQYGPRVPVPEDADAQTKLLGFIGRDPGWAPPS